ncbi:MAG: metal-sensing transcriptional repressor [Spirochaetaceae bacterium]|jgi:DNA-binding FrmR family transcriptional regulator|nr:metal-sensing transcriptional repressor [Spirochaetaceae bacterium]
MKETIDSDILHKRVRRIIGQLNGVERMIDADAPCADILIQLNSAKKSLHKTGQAVLEAHINKCVIDAVEHRNTSKAIGAFAAALEQFSRMA